VKNDLRPRLVPLTLRTGISGYPYAIQRSTNLVNWTTILTTNAPSSNAFRYQDTFSDIGALPASAYYRLLYNP